MRIAIVSTPRSGNCWIRSVLAGTMGVAEQAVHSFEDLQPDLPESMVLQVHWYRDERFVRWLQDRSFQVIVCARHPLDVLISAIRYAQYEPGVERWLGGNTAIRHGKPGLVPASREFLDYALSEGAEHLLAISHQWWTDPSAWRIRYEDFVRDPVGQFAALIERVHGDTSRLPDLLEHLSILRMRHTPNQHGWHGRPGLWRETIPYVDARRIYHRHRDVFLTLGYTISPRWLTRRQARANWIALNESPLSERIPMTRENRIGSTA